MQSELLKKRDPYFFFCSRAENLDNTRTDAVKLFGSNKEDVALIKVMDVNIYSDSVGIRVAEVVRGAKTTNDSFSTGREPVVKSQIPQCAIMLRSNR